MYEATGDERLGARALSIVGELRKVQQALPSRGMHAGYLSAFPEEFFDRVEARRGVWAPYYTLHKIMAGLLDVHRATGDRAALQAVEGMAAWVGLRAKRLTDEQWQKMLETEFGGMQDVLTELHVTTGDEAHLRLARLFDHRALFDPLARGDDPLDSLHANTQIPKTIGAARDCEVTGEQRYCAVAETFWERVALHRSYAIGGHSEDEHFSPVAHLSRHLGESTAETCNTYNMLKLSRRLFLRDGDPRRIEFYEGGLFNHILPSQDPATGMVTTTSPSSRGRGAPTRPPRTRSGAAWGRAWRTRPAMARRSVPARATPFSSTSSSPPSCAGARRASPFARTPDSPTRTGRASCCTSRSRRASPCACGTRPGFGVASRSA
jgi:DUF1680 family protein